MRSAELSLLSEKQIPGASRLGKKLSIFFVDRPRVVRETMSPVGTGRVLLAQSLRARATTFRRVAPARES